MTPAFIRNTLFHITASGLVNGIHHYEAYARLAALLGVADTAAYSAIERQAKKAHWLSFSARSDWYTGILDYSLMCLSASYKEIACVAITDTD